MRHVLRLLFWETLFVLNAYVAIGAIREANDFKAAFAFLGVFIATNAWLRK